MNKNINKAAMIGICLFILISLVTAYDSFILPSEFAYVAREKPTTVCNASCGYYGAGAYQGAECSCMGRLTGWPFSTNVSGLYMKWLNINPAQYAYLNCSQVFGSSWEFNHTYIYRYVPNEDAGLEEWSSANITWNYQPLLCNPDYGYCFNGYGGPDIPNPPPNSTGFWNLSAYGLYGSNIVYRNFSLTDVYLVLMPYIDGRDYPSRGRLVIENPSYNPATISTCYLQTSGFGAVSNIKVWTKVNGQERSNIMVNLCANSSCIHTLSGALGYAYFPNMPYNTYTADGIYGGIIDSTVIVADSAVEISYLNFYCEGCVKQVEYKGNVTYLSNNSIVQGAYVGLSHNYTVVYFQYTGSKGNFSMMVDEGVYDGIAVYSGASVLTTTHLSLNLQGFSGWFAVPYYDNYILDDQSSGNKILNATVIDYDGNLVNGCRVKVFTCIDSYSCPQTLLAQKDTNASGNAIISFNGHSGVYYHAEVEKTGYNCAVKPSFAYNTNQNQKNMIIECGNQDTITGAISFQVYNYVNGTGYPLDNARITGNYSSGPQDIYSTFNEGTNTSGDLIIPVNNIIRSLNYKVCKTGYVCGISKTCCEVSKTINYPNTLETVYMQSVGTNLSNITQLAKVQGYILDGYDNTSLPGATVILYCNKLEGGIIMSSPFSTGIDGSYVIHYDASYLPLCWIGVQKGGFGTYTGRNNDTFQMSNPNTITRNITLYRSTQITYTLKVLLVDKDNKPFNNNWVQIIGRITPTQQESQSDTTDADGYVIFDVQPALWNIYPDIPDGYFIQNNPNINYITQRINTSDVEVEIVLTKIPEAPKYWLKGSCMKKGTANAYTPTNCIVYIKDVNGNAIMGSPITSSTSNIGIWSIKVVNGTYKISGTLNPGINTKAEDVIYNLQMDVSDYATIRLIFSDLTELASNTLEDLIYYILSLSPMIKLIFMLLTIAALFTVLEVIGGGGAVVAYTQRERFQ